MRSPGLYPKILVSFLVLLLLVQVLMFVSFLLFNDGPPHARPDAHLQAVIRLARQRAAGVIAQAGGRPAPAALQELTADLAQNIGGLVWISTGDGAPLAAAPGPPPAGIMARLASEGRAQDGLRVLPLPPRQLLIASPLDLAGHPGAGLHLLLQHPPGPPPDHQHFLIRLALICLLVAMLVIPVSRLIARPIRKLRRAALMIADGDLDHRAPVSTRDEIGELGRALNHMADRLQQMILASRELLAYVSHELRSPLARLNLAAELLQDGLGAAAGPDDLRHLDDVRQEIARMDELLARILMLSRLDLAQAPPGREPLDLAALAAAAAAKWEPWLNHNGLELTLDLAGPAPVLGDAEALNSAIANLLDNAGKHAQGPGRASLDLARDGGAWRLTIVNPARSLCAAELEAIFAPFHRAAGHGEGSGLGLALSRRIIAAHGGAIVARNQPEGLALIVTLPAA
ncbi:MAG: HAMP domain-containing sensor histidine kinase [Pseudomonadota bacterium]